MPDSVTGEVQRKKPHAGKRLRAVPRILLVLLVPLALVGGLARAATRTLSATTTGPVAAYSFDEGTGTTVNDASGSGNNGTAANTAWVTGHTGNALSFNGSSSRVTVPDTASLHLTNAMTLEAWVRRGGSMSGWRDVIYKGDDNYYLVRRARPRAIGPAGGGIIGGSYGEVVRRLLRCRTRPGHTSPLTYDGVDRAPLRQRHAGREPREDAARSRPRRTRSRSAATRSTASTSTARSTTSASTPPR